MFSASSEIFWRRLKVCQNWCPVGHHAVDAERVAETLVDSINVYVAETNLSSCGLLRTSCFDSETNTCWLLSETYSK